MIDLFPGKVQAWLATTGLTILIGSGLGAAAVLAWEHQTPFGLGHKVEALTTERAKLTASRDAFAASYRSAVAENVRWDGAYKRLEQARQDDATAFAATLAARADEQARQCRAAYQSGVTAGRALGPRGTGNENAPIPGPGADAGGLLDDLADSWRSGAYRPGD